MNGTQIAIVGNVTADPELRFLETGVAIARLSVAVNPRIREADGTWVDGDPSFYRVTAWRTLAEHVTESVRKGVRVIVVGTIAERRWKTDTGEQRSAFEVTATTVGVDLTWATATVTRVGSTRNATGDPDDPWQTAGRSAPSDRLTDDAPF